MGGDGLSHGASPPKGWAPGAHAFARGATHGEGLRTGRRWHPLGGEAGKPFKASCPPRGSQAVHGEPSGMVLPGGRCIRTGEKEKAFKTVAKP